MNPANASPLLQMLAAASDPLQAKAAEAALEQAAATPGFASALLNVASSTSNDSNSAPLVPVAIRQAAALYLKNVVIRPHWSDDTENFRAPLVRGGEKRESLFCCF